MKKYFFLGVFWLILFEAANVYLIMPMPGSQRAESIELAYFLYSWRWAFRLVAVILIGLGIRQTWLYSKWITLLTLVVCGGLVYIINQKMAADNMFLQPSSILFLTADQSQVERQRLVIGIEHDGLAKAYPIQYLGYHHQVRDTIGQKPVMVTYCTVCRTGRVYEPIVNGQIEQFRLVGMDHFNAMFEDASTKTWWRQVTGEAVAGPLKGQYLPEWPSWQGTLDTWLKQYPNSLILQPDAAFAAEYDAMDEFERGRKTGTLTRYDTASWQEKSWIIGLELEGQSKAYDWNELKTRRIIHDELAHEPVMIVLAEDGHSFYAFRRRLADQQFVIRQDTLSDGQHAYSLTGIPFDTLALPLQLIQAYQEYWHSWKTFHPATEQYR